MNSPNILITTPKYNKITPKEAVENIDELFEIMKLDIEQILTKVVHQTISNFDDFASAGLVNLKKNLKKDLRGVKKFFNLNDSLVILKVLLRKMVSYARNQMQTNRKEQTVAKEMQKYISEAQVLDFVEFEDIEEDLTKFDKETLINGLKKMWENQKNRLNFDFEQIKYLCTKYKINLYLIIKKYELQTPKIGTLSGSNKGQTCMLYMLEGAA